MKVLEEFLSTVGILGALAPQQIAALARRAVEKTFRPGDTILRQGDSNSTLFLLRRGQLAVQVRRGDSYETVAHLYPGAPFGELSFITGRPCSGDVRAVTSADVALLPEGLLNDMPEERQLILESLATVLAERLHATVTNRTEVLQTPVVLLQAYPAWRARTAFQAHLIDSLARQVEWRTLRVDLGGPPTNPIGPIGGVDPVVLDGSGDPERVRDEVRRRLPEWRRQFDCIILDGSGGEVQAVKAAEDIADWHGHLLGPSDPIPRLDLDRQFVVQDASAASLPRLSGRHQVIAGAAAAEEAVRAQRPVGQAFLRTVDSIARCVAQTQVGLALGGGGAWGFAHVGVLRVLARAGIPVDVVTGCSMGSLVAGLLACGRDISYLEAATGAWQRRFPKSIEYRFWRMHLARVSAVTRLLREHFGETPLNRTEIPFWPNALDIETGQEVALTNGDIVTALMASRSLPTWLPPTHRDGRVLIDAAFIDPVPAALTREMHCNFVVAVNAIGPTRARALPAHFPFRAYELVSRSLRIVGHEMGRMRTDIAADVVLVPDVGDTHMLSFDRWQEIIAAGECEAETHLPAMVASYARLRRLPGAAAATGPA
jgi:NTE family protein